MVCHAACLKCVHGRHADSDLSRGTGFLDPNSNGGRDGERDRDEPGRGEPGDRLHDHRGCRGAGGV
jgi:hypothetical protein